MSAHACIHAPTHARTRMHRHAHAHAHTNTDTDTFTHIMHTQFTHASALTPCTHTLALSKTGAERALPPLCCCHKALSNHTCRRASTQGVTGRSKPARTTEHVRHPAEHGESGLHTKHPQGARIAVQTGWVHRHEQHMCGGNAMHSHPSTGGAVDGPSAHLREVPQDGEALAIGQGHARHEQGRVRLQLLRTSQMTHARASPCACPCTPGAHAAPARCPCRAAVAALACHRQALSSRALRRSGCGCQSQCAGM